MLVEIILAMLLGISVGVITGLLPGIHINLVITFLLGTSIISGSLNLPISIFIVALSFTHIMMDFIPTTLLGIPTEDNYLSAQPAHKLVMEGQASQAMRIAFRGVLLSIPLIILLSPIYLFLLPSIFQGLEKVIPYLLLLLTLYLIFDEKDIISGFFIFILSGILGFLAFNLPVQEPLLPLLSGLFGISAIFAGISEISKIPQQKNTEEKIDSKEFIKPGLASLVLSPILSFFPGIGAGHISLFSAQIINPSGKQFIFLNSISSSLNMALSIFAAYSIGKTRTGTSAAILDLLSPISKIDLLIIIISIILSIVIAYLIAIKISSLLIQLYNRVPYATMSILTVIFVIILNIIFSNSLGLVILAIGTAIGIICQKLQVRKIQMMGSLLLATLFYYFVI